jgi:hypothetical protein
VDLSTSIITEGSNWTIATKAACKPGQRDPSSIANSIITAAAHEGTIAPPSASSKGSFFGAAAADVESAFKDNRSTIAPQGVVDPSTYVKASTYSFVDTSTCNFSTCSLANPSTAREDTPAAIAAQALVVPF